MDRRTFLKTCAEFAAGVATKYYLSEDALAAGCRDDVGIEMSNKMAKRVREYKPDRTMTFDGGLTGYVYHGVDYIDTMVVGMEDIDRVKRTGKLGANDFFSVKYKDNQCIYTSDGIRMIDSKDRRMLQQAESKLMRGLDKFFGGRDKDKTDTGADSDGRAGDIFRNLERALE
jgi:hypothetical protein